MEKHIKDIVQHGLDNLDSLQEDSVYGCDLHHELYNMDYFIIGYYPAEQFLINGPGIFAAIGEIQEYEQEHFGNVTTDLSSSEKVVNMYAYIQGEEILAGVKHLEKVWNKRLSTSDIKKIRKELEKMNQ